jgi:hypothetical protein
MLLIFPIRSKEFLITIIALTLSFTAYPQKVDQATREENEKCLKCHSKRIVSFTSDSLGRTYKQKMYTDCIIDTSLYYTSNHFNFKCVDCHSSDYEIFPHNAQLRFEELPSCLDCHGDDPAFADFQFEKIQAEFDKSVHSSKHSDQFTCWSCHNSHYYKINARDRKQDLKHTIAYDNAICLSCHSNFDNYRLYVDRMNPNVTMSHDWLPNQVNHFQNVRCIECHAMVSDSLTVAHLILPKLKAVKKCAECHSANSRLRASLYKLKLSKPGLFSDRNIGDAVLIGSPRSTTIDLLSNLLIIITAAGLIFHLTMRIITRKKNMKHG